MTTYDVIRKYKPDATDELCEFIIWEHTGYPEFWNIPEDGNTPRECFENQVKKFFQHLPLRSGC